MVSFTLPLNSDKTGQSTNQTFFVQFGLGRSRPILSYLPFRYYLSYL